MSIKTLFEKQKQATLAVKTVQSNTVQELISELETSDYLTQYQNSVNLYLQDVNFATASNFAKYGSARKYYENIVERITNYFPYDGSKAKQLEFENNLNPFEKYIYLYEYPRSTGFVNFAPSGWGTRSGAQVNLFGNPNTKEYISFYNTNNDNVYDPLNGLKENTRFIFSSGSTIEFWLNKSAYTNPANQTEREAIFYTATTGSDNKDKRFVIFLDSNTTGSIFASYATDLGTTIQFSFQYDTGLSTIADSTWHHYAFTFYHTASNYYSDFYFDGVYKNTQAFNVFPAVDLTGSAFCTIGALGGGVFTSANLLGWGKLSGSIDEFRFWNTKRNAKQIGLNYFTNVGGGNNLVENNNIGIYYKFNEGETNDTSIDSIILDYAGRNCNGLFTGYNSRSRSTLSAISIASESTEPGDPILQYINPNVQRFLTVSLASADEYDYSNNFSLANSLPRWILDEDEKNGNILINFLQTLASYLDTLHLQITTFKNLKNKEYLNYEGKAPPFSDLLLTSNGFDLPALFLNTDIVQSFLNQDNKQTYDEKINDLKNIIYKNIYNNLNIINKSKGTENSIKQLIKNFGAQDTVYNLNIYANNTQYVLEDMYESNYVKKDYIDFTPFINVQNSQGTIYQYNNNSFITGTSNPSLSFTAECDFIAPKFPITYDRLAYEKLTYTTSSIFGIDTAVDTENDLAIPAGDLAGLKARLIYRDDNGYFALTCSAANITLTSSVFVDLMSDQHWNLSFKLVPVSTGSSYNLIFSGYSNFASSHFREFSVSASLTTAQGNDILSNNKRLYVGAQRVARGVEYPSIIKGLSVRYWADELTSDELKDHARNPLNYGRQKPYDPYTLATGSYIPKAETLLLYWDFSNVTSSDNSGNVSVVYDLTSGSSSGNSFSNNPLQNLVGKNYSGAGKGFESRATVKYKDLVYASEQQIPENLYSSQLINILQTDDDYYTTTIKPQKYFFALENSMYDVISKNMLNLFASIVEYNNFIGEPLNTYKSQYSKLKYFRTFFFERVENTPDLDRYVGIYKWLDDALDSILFNLLPASANASEKVRTIVENHILERSKIKYPLLPDKAYDLKGGNTAEDKKDPIYFVIIKDLKYMKTLQNFVQPKGSYVIEYENSLGPKVTPTKDINTINKQVVISAAKIKKI